MTMEHMKPGTTFAQRYRIERFLAQGGFGAVYVAEQLATELRVALKVLWPHVLASGDAVEKFKQEARIAGRVNSDHIVRVIDAGFDEPTSMPFLVMELLQGEDLQKIVERSGPLSPALVAVYLRQTASALDRAHGFRDRDGRVTPIIHRDLKPENLFVSHREDGTPLVKVLDFGIAKVLSDATKASQQVKGTPLYMAFEQAAGAPIAPTADVWALGLIAFFLLTGKSYWRAASTEGSGLAQLFGEVLSLPIVPPSQRVAEMGWGVALPPAFDAWFVRCVHREPASRFRSAGEAAIALASALGQEAAYDRPSLVAPASIGAPWSMATPPSVASLTPSSAPALSPASVVSSSSEQPSRPLGATSLVALGASQPIPGRRSLAPLVAGGVAALALVAGLAIWVHGGGGASRVDARASAAPVATPTPLPSIEPPASATAAVSAAAPTVAPAPAPTATASPLAPAAHPSALPHGAHEAHAPKPTPAPAPSPAAAPAPTPKTKDVYGER